jgi:hypothetical protein
MSYGLLGMGAVFFLVGWKNGILFKKWVDI